MLQLIAKIDVVCSYLSLSFYLYLVVAIDHHHQYLI
jgi:hypothetical protein